MNMHAQPTTKTHQERIDEAYAAAAVLGLIHHAADSINSSLVDAAAAQKLAGDIRRATELVEEMTEGLIDHLERTNA